MLRRPFHLRWYTCTTLCKHGCQCSYCVVSQAKESVVQGTWVLGCLQMFACSVPCNEQASLLFPLQVEYSEALHPEVGGRDAALFDATGLLRPPSVMAHATCLTDSELSLLGQRGAAVAHCPLSNFFFGDRIFHVRHALRLGVKV